MFPVKGKVDHLKPFSLYHNVFKRFLQNLARYQEVIKGHIFGQ